jgi:hypothetical protein
MASQTMDVNEQSGILATQATVVLPFHLGNTAEGVGRTAEDLEDLPQMTSEGQENIVSFF